MTTKPFKGGHYMPNMGFVIAVCLSIMGSLSSQGEPPRTAAEIQKLVDSMVQIPGKAYKIGKTEVTQSQWESVMGNNPSRVKHPDNPVEEVSWNDCQTFIQRLNSFSVVQRSGLVFRLPTEEEWAFACRAGSSGDFCRLADGTEITEDSLGEVAWYFNNTGNGCNPHPVGQKKPNAFGLFDVHGNVAEWTQTAVGESRGKLGGGSSSWGAECQVSRKNRALPNESRYDCGFRLCAETDKERKTREKKDLLDQKSRDEALLEQQKIIVPKIISEMIQIPGKNYKLGRTEVTQLQWEAMMGEKPSKFNGKENPVENVSWLDCQRFLARLNLISNMKEKGFVFRLPTEEEWEFACKAGSTGDYCCLLDGTDITEKTLEIVAWFKYNSNEQTHPVRQKKPNAFGLYDMLGNVYEWTDTVKWGNFNFIKGGGFASVDNSCKSAFQGNWARDEQTEYIGFRLCLAPIQEERHSPSVSNGDHNTSHGIIKQNYIGTNGSMTAYEKCLNTAMKMFDEKNVAEQVVNSLSGGQQTDDVLNRVNTQLQTLLDQGKQSNVSPKEVGRLLLSNMEIFSHRK